MDNRAKLLWGSVTMAQTVYYSLFDKLPSSEDGKYNGLFPFSVASTWIPRMYM